MDRHSTDIVVFSHFGDFGGHHLFSLYSNNITSGLKGSRKLAKEGPRLYNLAMISQKSLITRLMKKEDWLEKKIAQAKRKMGKVEGPMQSWSSHAQTDIKGELHLLLQQLKTVKGQLHEVRKRTNPKPKQKTVTAGSIVTIEIDDEKKTFLLIDSPSGSPEQSLLSTQSPIGKALIGKKEGQSFTISTPTGPLKIKITKTK